MAMMGSGIAAGEDRAREAAEAAISSPLLEDVNLSGARGILVNVTAGMDLAIGEFRKVGETVKQCASDDATVVVGTVIDPELTDTIRVTVVATGLGQPLARREQPPMRVIRPQEGLRDGTTGQPSEPNYGSFERPTYQRRTGLEQAQDPAGEQSFDMLDIPAFLRRQAD